MKDIKLIGFGEIGKNVINNLTQCGFKPENCIIVHGIPVYLDELPARTKILLGVKSRFDEKYCYHTDDPLWESREILNQRELIHTACDKADMVAIVAGIDYDVEFGASTSTVMLIEKGTTVVLSILLKPFGNAILSGADTIVDLSDTTIMISLNQIRKAVPPGASILDVFKRGEEVVSATIFEIINGMSDENINKIPLQVFRSNGIGYVGIGTGPTILAAMEGALHSQMFEYSSLERATRILAYFVICQEANVNDLNDAMTALRNSLNSNVEILPSIRLDKGAELHRVSLLATRLL